MFKRLAVLFVFAGVSVAGAATLKMKWFDGTTGDNQDGIATLHYVPGLFVTKIHVTITGFEPSASYGISIDDGLIDSGTANGILTNPAGNGEVNLTAATDITGTPRTIQVYIDSDGDGYYTPASENYAGDEVVAYGTAE